MKSTGNGDPKTCTENLLKCTRGEIPYDRIKGLPADIIDKPYNTAVATARQEADWLIGTYEPRVVVNSIKVEQTGSVDGGFSITADVKEKEE